MQPYHAIDDGRWAAKRLNDQRLKGTYAFNSLLQQGARLTFGSDWPVAPSDSAGRNLCRGNPSDAGWGKIRTAGTRNKNQR